MSTGEPKYKFSTAGKILLENVPLSEAERLIAEKSILPTDHYWTDGMTDWKLVSSKVWEKPRPTPEQSTVKPKVPETKSVADMTSSAQANVTLPPPPILNTAVIEKGFSPYVGFYRSDDNRWVFGILGGIAHRNSWPSAILVLLRLVLIFSCGLVALVIPIYVCAGLLLPSLPTEGKTSYYDLRGGAVSRDEKELSRFAYMLVVLIAVIWLLFTLKDLFRKM